MIDTGAGQNLIKEDVIKSNVIIKRLNCLRLPGITVHPVCALRQMTINNFSFPAILNIIPNEVTIKHDDVLGTEFF